MGKKNVTKKSAAKNGRPKVKSMPKKTWRTEETDKSLSAKKTLENGSTGVNVRSDSARPEQDRTLSQQSPGSLNTTTVFVTVTTRSIAYLAMGIVLKALKRGSLSAQSFQEAPYYMFRYLNDTFVSCMKSGIMKVTTCPLWLWELLYALKPKQNRFKTGFINYSWRIEDDGHGLDQVFTLGTGEDNYAIFWGTGPPTSTISVNGFPVLGPVPPYTEDLGLNAISSMWPFVMQSGEKLVADPGPDGVTTGKDTSAFAVVYPELGESFSSSGGVRTTIYSERHIDSPILCQFGVYQPPGQPFWRGWHDARVGAGSPCSIGPVMIDNRGKYHRNKNVPILKFYNFDEFWEQLSLTLCLANEKLIAAGEQYLTCPLNANKAALLLRQAILQVCNNDMAQDVRYSGSSFIDMLPFTVGPNGTLSSGSVGILLPTFLAENIRAIAHISTKTSEKYNSTVSWYPVLARPPSEELPTKFVFGDGVPLYADQGTDAVINVIDCSALVGQDTVYVDLTRIEMATMVEMWNTWITGLSAVMSPLVTISSEKGIVSINCNTYTNLQEKINFDDVVTTTTGVAKAKKTSSSSKLVIGEALHRRLKETVKVDGSSYLQGVGDRKTSSLSGFSAPLDQIIDSFILPVNLSEDALEDASYQGYQSFMIEPSSKPRSSLGGFGNVGSPDASLPSAWDRHKRAAAIDIKAFGTAGQNNEIISAFEQMGKIGRGGFLTSALSGLANMFIPGSGKFVQAVLDV